MSMMPGSKTSADLLDAAIGVHINSANLSERQKKIWNHLRGTLASHMRSELRPETAEPDEEYWFFEFLFAWVMDNRPEKREEEG